MQHNEVARPDRTTFPMSKDLVHPSRVIHQHTIFQRHRGGSLPPGAITTIPFFEALHTGPRPLARNIEPIRTRKPSSEKFRFLRNELLANFGSLNTISVDWALKHMVHVCVRHDLPSESYSTPMADRYRQNFENR
jgi:hypothetical protein